MINTNLFQKSTPNRSVFITTQTIFANVSKREETVKQRRGEKNGKETKE